MKSTHNNKEKHTQSRLSVSKGVSLCLWFVLSIISSFLMKTRDCNIQKGEIISKNYFYFDDLKIVG